MSVVGGGNALRRQARGYAFNLGWEAALIIARRVVADNLMAAAIPGEQARWVREDGVTTYVRQNTKLSLTLLDRVKPATTLAEIMAVAMRFDWFVELINDNAGADELWELFFEDALPHDDIEARARVRAALLLTENSAGFENDGSPKMRGMPGMKLTHARSSINRYSVRFDHAKANALKRSAGGLNHPLVVTSGPD